MTEDILEEQTQIILSLGKSEGGSKYLAQMQSASLYSDVQAFKVIILIITPFFNDLCLIG